VPRLLLVDPDTAFRLRAIALLTGRFELSIPAHGDDPLRAARTDRPDIALLAAGDRSRAAAIRLARVLKTDVRAVPAIGLYTRPGEAGPSAAAFAATGAEGFLASTDDPAALLAFAEALARGERPAPAPWPGASAGPVRRLLGKMLGR
jgi:DNA-binding NarL/FixJ family response regulator